MNTLLFATEAADRSGVSSPLHVLFLGRDYEIYFVGLLERSLTREYFVVANTLKVFAPFIQLALCTGIIATGRNSR